MKRVISFFAVVILALSFSVSVFAADSATIANAQEIKTFFAGIVTKYPGLGIKSEDLNAANNFFDYYINIKTITAEEVETFERLFNEGVAIYANNEEETDLSKFPAEVRARILAKVNEAFSVFGLNATSSDGVLKFVRIIDGAEIYSSSATMVKSTGSNDSEEQDLAKEDTSVSLPVWFCVLNCSISATAIVLSVVAIVLVLKKKK